MQWLDFCIRLLKFNIYNKTNFMHRKNLKFRKSPSHNEVLSSLIKGSSKLKILKCYALNGENGNSLGAGGVSMLVI